MMSANSKYLVAESHSVDEKRPVGALFIMEISLEGNGISLNRNHGSVGIAAILTFHVTSAYDRMPCSVTMLFIQRITGRLDRLR